MREVTVVTRFGDLNACNKARQAESNAVGASGSGEDGVPVGTELEVSLA